MRSLLGASLLLGLGACLAAPPEGVQPLTAQPSAERQRRLAQGRRIYNFRCYFCHGYSGDGNTLASSFLNPRPRNFSVTTPAQLSLAQMQDAVTRGRPGSAMQGFASVLTADEIAAVVDFVRQEFMVDKAPNTRYHTAENGWPQHQQHAAAFGFATGQLSLEMPAESLTPEQRAGRRLFLSACISCHDRGGAAAQAASNAPAWEARPLSYPRNGFVPGDAASVDTVSGASPYHLHDKAPERHDLTALERRGQAIYQANCAFCHAADGTGKNWIGSFLQPHPRDLTQAANMAHMTPQRLTQVIRNGLPGTSMPAWKSVLSATEIQGVVAYIGRVFYPLGAAASASGSADAKAVSD